MRTQMRTQMKTQLTNKPWSIIAIAILLIAFGSSNAFAVPPTEAGVTITSVKTKVQVNYQVGGIAQPTVNPDKDCYFTVDNKINHTISVSTASTAVTPGSQYNLLTYKLSNTGNKKQAYIVTRTKLAGAAAMQNCEVWYDTSATGLTGNVETNTDVTKITDKTGAITTFFNLEYNTESNNIYVRGDFNTDNTNGQEANIEIIAQACDAGTTNFTNQETMLDVFNTEQVVWADGDGNGGLGGDIVRDGKFSAFAKFVVSTATLGVSKTSVVLRDPFNGVTNPKRIPGAIVQYITTISNSGGTAATSIVLTDDLTDEVVTSKTIAYDPGSILVRAPNCFLNVETNLTDTDDDPGTDYGQWASPVITVGNIELPAGTTATVKFNVEIL